MSAPKHESAGNEVTADGIVHRCSCGWVSPPCFSNAAASCLGIDHRAQAKPTNGEGSVMNTTPPMTDAEFLAYIERTPECATCLEQINPFNRGYWVHGSAVHGSAGGYMPYKYKEIARAFHTHDQRVREEEREACAKLIEQRGELYVSKWMNVDDMEAQAKAYAWESRQHAIAIRSLTKQGGK